MSTSDSTNNNGETFISHYVIKSNASYGEDGSNSTRPSSNDKGFILDSRDKFRYRWDFFIVLLLLYVSSISAYVIAFIGTLSPSSPFFWIERFLDVSFLIDIALNFVTLYYANNSERDELMKLDSRTLQRNIILRYLSTFFFFDVLSVIPWDMISPYNDGELNNMIELFKYLRLLRLLKLFRLIRIIRLNHSFLKLENRIRIKYAYLRLIVLGVSLAFIAHWVACIFYFFGTTTESRNNEFAPWLADGVPDDYYSKYVLALYFSVYTITTIGYGDVVPGNTVERTYVTIIMFFGAACFGWAISQISNITSEVKQSSIKYRQQMDNLLDYCHVKKIPAELSDDLREYVQDYYSNRTNNDESELFDILPGDFKLKICKYLYARYVISLFKGLLPNDDDYKKINLDIIFITIKERAFIKNEYLYTVDDPAEYVYIVKAGSVVINYHGVKDTTGGDIGTTTSTMQKVYGKDSIIGITEIMLNKKRETTVKVRENSDILVIPRKHLLNALRSNEHIWRSLQNSINHGADGDGADSMNSNDFISSLNSMDKEALKDAIIQKNQTIKVLQNQLSLIQGQLESIMHTIRS